MARIITGPGELFARLAQMIVLPEHIRHMTISLGVDEIPTVECEFIPELNSEFTTTKRYRLEEIQNNQDEINEGER